MKTAVIYKSSTGFTKKYAEWISKELNCDIMELKTALNSDLNGYDTIIYGGGLIAGMVNGLSKIKPQLAAFKGKILLLFVGATPMHAIEQKQIDDMLAAALKETKLNNMQVFYVQGGLDYGKMNMLHSVMMKMFCSMIKKQKGADSEQYKTIASSFDATNKEFIMPLCSAAKV